MIHDLTKTADRLTRDPGYIIIPNEFKNSFAVYTDDGYGNGDFVGRFKTHAEALQRAKELDKS